MATNPLADTWHPKLVAVDADGTIADTRGAVPAAVAAKLRAIAAAGTPVVLVTGRAWLSAQLILDQLALPHMYAVCNNGATVVTYPPLNIVHSVMFDPAPVLAVVARHPTTIVAVEDFARGYKVSGPFVNGLFPLHGEITTLSLAELAAEPASRLILHDEVATTAEFGAMLAELDLSGLSHSRGGDNWYDLASGAAGKDKGLALVAATFGVAQEDVLAFGDGENDLPMLAWAGRGVALGDASPLVRAIADDIAPAFADGGILPELEYWFPEA